MYVSSCVYVVNPYIFIATFTVWKKSRFILLERSDFHMIDKQSIAIHVFFKHKLTSLSVDEVFLPMYVVDNKLSYVTVSSGI